jgi:hypothetical protein
VNRRSRIFLTTLVVSLALASCAAPQEVPDGEGRRLATVFEVDESIVIDAPAERVFALVSDFRRDGSWRDEVISMESLDGGFTAVGGRFREVARLPLGELVTITAVRALEPTRRVAVQTEPGAPLWLSSERSVEPTPCGARFRYRVRAENTSLFPTALVRVIYAGMVRSYVRNLRALLEEGAPVSAGATSR